MRQPTRITVRRNRAKKKEKKKRKTEESQVELSNTNTNCDYCRVVIIGSTDIDFEVWSMEANLISWQCSTRVGWDKKSSF